MPTYVDGVLQPDLPTVYAGTVRLSNLVAGVYRVGARVRIGLTGGAAYHLSLLEDFEVEADGAERDMLVRSYFTSSDRNPNDFDASADCLCRPFGPLGTPADQGEPHAWPANYASTCRVVSTALSPVALQPDQVLHFSSDWGGAGSYHTPVVEAAWVDHQTLRVAWSCHGGIPTAAEMPGAYGIWSPAKYVLDAPGAEVTAVVPAAGGLPSSFGNGTWSASECVDLTVSGAAATNVTAPEFTQSLQGMWHRPAAPRAVGAPPMPPVQVAGAEYIGNGTVHVTFSRAMSQELSPQWYVDAYQLQPSGPALGFAQWLADGVRLEVNFAGLAPDTTYWLTLNPAGDRDWTAADGGALSPRTTLFATPAAATPEPVSFTITLQTDSQLARETIIAVLQSTYAAMSPGMAGPTAQQWADYFTSAGYPATFAISRAEPSSGGHVLVLGDITWEQPAPTFGSLLPAALALLPPGRAFTRRLDSLLARVLDGLCLEFERVHDEAAALLANASPRRARREQDVAAWEEAAGAAFAGTLQDRAAQAADRLRGIVRRTRADFEATALAHGFTASWPPRTERQFVAGSSAAGDPVRGDAWCFYLRLPVTGPAEQLPALNAALRRITRAHTVVVAELEDAWPES